MIGSQLQKAIFEALSGVADGRIYDRVPPDAVFPYVTIGDEDILNDGNSCNDAWSVSATVHGWSRSGTGSKIEVKDLTADIVTVLENELTVTDFLIVVAELESARIISDPDGITDHAIITIRYELEPIE
ncbi:MAG: DUF3168 domain-containing protein [Rhodobacteraceae bacterium]|nr:DUF3168 domain-containing protein [Paracoccaceae bacterium]